ncbi:lytic polysaccharide monooxygenase [Jidongwangia harbinensis]|uniref:lytic polysaccharide monooxygenase n=1 Tax=Jidongwangia harbinensis TaxID=2878561 RepID=UPI001CD9C3D3|nr:lytic polysaccharide monooxygenase [Jidongwangia harbinensis]MCA2215966.1 lytic polysaccharide monooxygenase [Jidongwangia harbinensis]
MSARVTVRRASLARLLALAAAALAVVAVTGTAPTPAYAHGNIIDAPSRNVGCWLRWGNDFNNPAMQTQDPMCWQAWRANPNTMWNWMGLYRDGMGRNFQSAVPDGTLCSMNRAQNGLGTSLDAVGNWRAKDVGRNFRLTLLDQASHGADFIRVYLTKAGFDPTTQPLGWGDLDLVTTVGNTPASQWQRVTTPTSGVQLSFDVAANHSGRAVVLTIWQASHNDQAYFMCSDVNIA